MLSKERELIWLLRKIKDDEEFIETMEEFFFDRHYEWHSDFTGFFMDRIKELKDQLYYKEYRLEQLSWQIIKIREDLEIGVLPVTQHGGRHLGSCLCRIRDSRGGDTLAR